MKFQLGEVPSRGILRDCKFSANLWLTFVSCSILQRPCQDNTVALGAARGFADPQRRVVVLLDPPLELAALRRVVEGLGHEGEVPLAELLLHGLEVVPHEILAAQGVGGGELVEPYN